MKKSVLVLSLSCDIDFYINEEKIIRKTWGREILDGTYDNFDLFFMHSSDKDFIDFDNNIIYTKSPDDYNGTGFKTILSLELIRQYKEHDYIILTNTATVLNLKLISEFIDSDAIDENKFYGGLVVFPAAHIPFFRGDFILLSKNSINYALEGYKQFSNKSWPNDEFIFMCITRGNKFLSDGKEFENSFMQVKSIDNFEDLKISDIGGNFYINTKLLNRKNNDIIISNMISAYYLIKSDKNKYDFNDIVHVPNIVKTNNGIFKIEMVS